MNNNLKHYFRIFWNSFIVQSKTRAVDQYFLATLFVQPIVFTLISVGTYMYGQKAELGLFAVLGTGLISIWNNNLFTSSEIIRGERRLGTLSLVLATPTPFLVILFGKSFANAVASVIAMGITLLTGFIVFRLPIDIKDPLAFVIGLVLVIISISCLGLVFGSLFILTRNAGEFVSVANFPVYILSGLSVPFTLLPLWTRPLSNMLSPTWGNIVLNQAATGNYENLFFNYMWLGGLSVIYLIIAYFLYKQVEYRAFSAGTLEQF